VFVLCNTLPTNYLSLTLSLSRLSFFTDSKSDEIAGSASKDIKGSSSTTNSHPTTDNTNTSAGSGGIIVASAAVVNADSGAVLVAIFVSSL